MKTLSLLVTILFISLISFAQRSRDANRSQDAAKNGFSALWGRNGENWDPAGQLPDFSFAGYDMGDSEIPSFPVKARLGENGTRPNDGRDDSQELQRLINNLDRPGTIIIPNGVWNINRRITIEGSGVVLRGENGAEFRMNRTLREIDNEPSGSNRYAFSDAFFTMRGAIRTGAQRRIIANVNQGSTVIPVEDGVRFQAGDMIEITQLDPDDESLFLHIHGTDQERRFWFENDDRCDNDRLLNRKDLFRFRSKVISQSGNRVTLARPLPVEISTRWTPRIAEVNRNTTIQNQGIENIRFRMNGEPFVGHFILDGSSAIIMINTANSWVRDVEIIDSDNGVNVKGGMNCVIEDITISTTGRDDSNNTGHHAIWLSGCTDFLVSNCDIQTTYIHDISAEGSATQNVFSKIKGRDLNLDHHRAAPYGNLFTEIDMGRGDRPFASSGLPCRGAHSGRYTTFWNLTKNSGDFEDFPFTAGGRPRRELAKDYNFGNGIGIRGSRLSPRSESFSQFIEFSFGETLQNPNLYEAQLQRRFNRNTPPAVNLTAPTRNQVFILGDTIPLTATASDADGSIARVNFNVDDVLFSTDPGTPFVREYIPTQTGTFKISAIAFDDGGATTEDFVNVRVVANQSPTITITSPRNNQTFTLGDTIVIRSNAADADGTVARVRYTINNEAPTFHRSLFETIFVPTQTGTYTILANTRDERGANGDTQVTITVQENNRGPNGYTLDVNEGEIVQASGLDVAYGFNGNYVFLFNQTGDITCDNTTFGEDPAPGFPKRCFVRNSADYTPPLTYTETANQGQTISANGEQDIAFGANGNFEFLFNQTTDISCDVNTFGNDPAVGFPKRCFTRPSADFTPPPGFTEVAEENETVLVTETSDVAFGVNGNFVFLDNQTADVLCNRSAFGSDPERGYEKRCFTRPSIVTSTVDLEEQNAVLEVFPNPSIDGIFKLSQEIDWEVVNAEGTIIKKGDSNEVDLSQQIIGSYFLKTKAGTFKLIIQ